MQAPFHPGELAAHALGGAGTPAELARMMRDEIPASALPFVAQQRWIVLASTDAAGRVAASVLCGAAGFLSATARALTIDLGRSFPTADGDPLWAHVAAGARLGALLIEPATRRRLRVNGDVAEAAAGRLVIDVREAFPNCPKYIQRREIAATRTIPATLRARPPGAALDAPARRVLAQADTLFIASQNPAGWPDASHRGGAPGFIAAIDERTLRVADFAGNNLFNTFGNFLVHPAAGLWVPDFATGAGLQLSGRVAIEWQAAPVSAHPAATGRVWTFAIDDWRHVENALPFTWTAPAPSPFLPA